MTTDTKALRELVEARLAKSPDALLRALLDEVERLREALDAINERAANWHTGFGTKENRRWIYETSGEALNPTLPAPPQENER